MVVLMRRRQALAPFSPFVGLNPYRQGAGPRPVFVAAAEVGGRYLCLEFQLGYSEVVTFAANRDDFPTRYVKLTEPLPQHLSLLKAQALKSGATLEAIQLLGAMMPLTNEEKAIMATTKLSKANTDGLKAAAKDAPVGGKKAPAKSDAKAATGKAKGNPAALEKAREARQAKASAMDLKKIKVLKKENPYRDGTKAHATFELFRGKATVADVKAAATDDHDLGYLRYASRDGHISLT